MVSFTATGAQKPWRRFTMAANTTLSCRSGRPWLPAEGKHVCIQQQFATWPALNHKPSPAAVQDGSLLLISRETNGVCFTPHANLSAVSTFTDATRLLYFHALIINHLQSVAANKSWSASQVRFAAAVSQLIAGNTRYFSNEFPCPQRHQGCEIKKKNYHTLLFL